MTTLTDPAKIRYRATFDAQVINFGSYNILVGTGVGGSQDRDFIIGYRLEPLEIILCPVEPGAARPLCDHVALFESDILSYVVDEAASTVGIITIKGDRHEMIILPRVPVTGIGDQTLMDQSSDAADFLGFSRNLASLLAPVS